MYSICLVNLKLHHWHVLHSGAQSSPCSLSNTSAVMEPNTMAPQATHTHSCKSNAPTQDHGSKVKGNRSQWVSHLVGHRV